MAMANKNTKAPAQSASETHGSEPRDEAAEAADAAPPAATESAAERPVPKTAAEALALAERMARELAKQITAAELRADAALERIRLLDLQRTQRGAEIALRARRCQEIEGELAPARQVLALLGESSAGHEARAKIARLEAEARRLEGEIADAEAAAVGKVDAEEALRAELRREQLAALQVLQELRATAATVEEARRTAKATHLAEVRAAAQRLVLRAEQQAEQTSEAARLADAQLSVARASASAELEKWPELAAEAERLAPPKPPSELDQVLDAAANYIRVLAAAAGSVRAAQELPTYAPGQVQTGAPGVFADILAVSQRELLTLLPSSREMDWTPSSPALALGRKKLDEIEWLRRRMAGRGGAKEVDIADLQHTLRTLRPVTG